MLLWLMTSNGYTYVKYVVTGVDVFADKEYAITIYTIHSSRVQRERKINIFFNRQI